MSNDKFKKKSPSPKPVVFAPETQNLSPESFLDNSSSPIVNSMKPLINITFGKKPSPEKDDLELELDLPQESNFASSQHKRLRKHSELSFSMDDSTSVVEATPESRSKSEATPKLKTKPEVRKRKLFIQDESEEEEKNDLFVVSTSSKSKQKEENNLDLELELELPKKQEKKEEDDDIVIISSSKTKKEKQEDDDIVIISSSSSTKNTKVLETHGEHKISPKLYSKSIKQKNSYNGFDYEEIEVDEEDLAKEREEQMFRASVRQREQLFISSHSKSKSSFLPPLTFHNSHILDIMESHSKNKDKHSRKKQKIEEESPEESDNTDLDGFIVEEDEEIETYSIPDEEQEEIESALPSKKRKSAYVEEKGKANPLDSLRNLYSLKDAFPIYLQYIISSLLDDNFMEEIQREEPENYFKPAIRKIEDAICNRKEFMMRSSVWGEDFKECLETLPIYRSFPNPSLYDCQACRRTNHNATFIVYLEGTPYDPKKVWDGTEKPPPLDSKKTANEESRVFYLGRFCHSRTEIFHKLHHYKYTLFQRVEKKLLQQEDKEFTLEETLNYLLDNNFWVNELYQELKELLDYSDNFGEEASSKT